MRTANPALSDKAFSNVERSGPPMTLSGTVNKTAMLLALSLITAMVTWGMAWESIQAAENGGEMNPMLMTATFLESPCIPSTIFFWTVPFSQFSRLTQEAVGKGEGSLHSSVFSPCTIEIEKKALNNISRNSLSCRL